MDKPFSTSNERTSISSNPCGSPLLKGDSSSVPHPHLTAHTALGRCPLPQAPRALGKEQEESVGSGQGQKGGEAEGKGRD